MTTKGSLSGRAGTLLWCAWCGEECSSSPGDYFWLPDDHVFECVCGELMVEAVRVVTHAPIVGVTA